MYDPQFRSGRARRRFTLGVILLVVGSLLLASRLGFVMPYHWWTYWPWLLLIVGGMQMAVPGSFRDRMAGYWLLVVGGWGLISTYEVMGLDWGNSWPIFIIAAGLRLLLGAVFWRPQEKTIPNSTPSNRDV